MFSDWKNFTDKLGAIRDKEIDVEELSKFLKLEHQQFPSFEEIQEYFSSEYMKKTALSSRTKWHKMDKVLLIWTMTKQVQYSMGNLMSPTEADFQVVANVLNLTLERLQIKWISLLKTKVKESPWTASEDQLILELKRKYKHDMSWTKLTLDFNAQNEVKVVRYAKQIRERWNNFLNPAIDRSCWSTREKIVLLELVQTYGKTWARISKNLKGRTDNQVKNQFNIIMKTYRRRVTDVDSDAELIAVSLRELRKIQNNLTIDTDLKLKLDVEPNLQKKQCITKSIDAQGVNDKLTITTTTPSPEDHSPNNSATRVTQPQKKLHKFQYPVLTQSTPAPTLAPVAAPVQLPIQAPLSVSQLTQNQQVLNARTNMLFSNNLLQPLISPNLLMPHLALCLQMQRAQFLGPPYKLY